MRRDMLNASDAVIALSHREARDLRAFFGVDDSAIHVVGNGTDERFFTASSDEFVARYRLDQVVLHVGSLEPIKNQLRLIEALDDATVPLVLIGPRQAREPAYADQVVRRLERAPRASWLGEVPYDSTLIASAFAAAKVLALPSLTEGQPLVALQAAAAGANLVLSDLPYLRDTFGDGAWYCNPRSPASIRRAVLDAYAAPRGARYTSAPGWLLTWTDVAYRLRDIYTDVLARRGRR
jgi:glycosyltransferase involved in cell wall biosynthesis